MSSSILSSTGNAPAQRVPAWKRLGLKLKPASDEQQGLPTSTNTNGADAATAAAVSPSVPNTNFNAKRKSFGSPAVEQQPNKRAKQDNNSWDRTPQALKKNVSFTAEATESQAKSPAPKTPVPNKKKQQPASKKSASTTTPAPPKPVRKAPVNLEPALAYLRQWHAARDGWKFNKNHQTRLLEQVFATDETTIPAVDIGVFYAYIRGLQGGVRTRLRQVASGIKAQDMEQGSAGFEAVKNSNNNQKEMAERKQKEYEDVVQSFLSQTRTPEKRRFDEVDYVLRTTDMEMQRRVVKRMRTEMVLDELSDSDDTETTSTTTTTTTSTEKGANGSGQPENTSSQNAAGVAEGDKRLKLNDGSQQRVKRKKKTRTAVVEDETSSESESESDSDTSSSDSSSSSEDEEDEEDEEKDGGAKTAAGSGTANEADTSSSSSSSSESSDSEEDE
ncbi:Uu.00g100500.m01.CDS01 [Anthostomella pinea]|uniref:Uu.00g100500.m01.CDS01 n=1 Tax=Anthostomella pinea TaxID=933095 RepID=A0AAI8VCY6_9PEZI|nr:Uu.00g100500.m01.CDS01 [Anthostomella pinea]